MRVASADRRDVLGAIGAGLAGLAAGLEAAPARAQQAPGPETAAADLGEVVDFHNHYVGPAFTAIAGAAAPAAQQKRWQAVNRDLSDPAALLASIERAGIAARVVNTPLEFIQDPQADVAAGTIARINDQLAELVAANPGRLYGLATIDAYGGEAGAREVERAVRELELRGLFLQAAKGEKFLDAAEARPTLAAAAAHGVPVFVHPITDGGLRKRFGRYGRLGTSLNRGTINSAALIALIEGGVFDELPGLKVVVTTLAIGAVLLIGGFGDGGGLRRDAPELARRHVYIDTMALHPVLVRAVVDLLGPDHVLCGTDWPIFTEASVSERLQTALVGAGLTAEEQRLVAGGNTLRLLGVA